MYLARYALLTLPAPRRFLGTPDEVAHGPYVTTTRNLEPLDAPRRANRESSVSQPPFSSGEASRRRGGERVKRAASSMPTPVATQDPVGVFVLESLYFSLK